MRKLGTNKPVEYHSLTPKTKATFHVKSMHLLCRQKRVNVDTLNKYSDNRPKVTNNWNSCKVFHGKLLLHITTSSISLVFLL